MDHQGRFRSAALEADIPDDEISTFLGHLRLSYRLSSGADGVPVGRFGGEPRLPEGVEWPSADGRPLPFVFAVDCAALPVVDGSGLPAKGSLFFFLAHEDDHLAAATGERKYARVLHVDAALDEFDLNATLVAELPGWFEPDEEEDEDDLSPFEVERAAGLERDLPHRAELIALADELWPPDNGLASAYLGGYVDDEVIESIAEQTLAGREKAGEIVAPVANWYSAVEKEAHRLSGEWLSLARFPLDDEFYYGSFVIRHDDLSAGRLDQALSVTEFSE
ncbi:DUF1963 domain-containing protein [Actinoplanes philippinensis]|uniref:DUF1963 domain-containing protein n=1 Tax=Actinoplanes philippinensis TaxID=35752 RepID=UPI00340CA67C